MEETKKCPYCGEEILAVAKKCRFCGEWFEEGHAQPIGVAPTVPPPPADGPQEVTVVVDTNPSSAKPNVKTAPTKKKTSANRPAIILAAAIIVVAVVFGIIATVVANKAQEEKAAAAAVKAQKNSEAAWLHSAQTIKEDAIAIADAADMILDDYSRNWRSAIYNNVAYNADNEKKYAKDFQDAVDWRIEYYGTDIAELESVNEAIQNRLKEMTEAPEKYASMQTPLNDIYTKTTAVVSLCKEPVGNLNTFPPKAQEAIADLRSAITATDILIERNSSVETDGYISTYHIEEGYDKSKEL